jgi:hypothetical protein
MKEPPLGPTTINSSDFLAAFIAAAVALGSVFTPAFGREASNPPPIKIAVFEFELEDLSASAMLLNRPASEAAVLESVSSAARQALARSGRYTVIDASRVDAQPIAEGALRNCGGCEAGIALRLGADQSLIGVVRKGNQIDYRVVIQIREARTGRILDQQEATFAGDESGWASGVRALIRHQILPTQN